MTKKQPPRSAAKKVLSKKITTKAPSKKAPIKKVDPKQKTIETLVELIKTTSTVVPDDVYRTLLKARTQEQEGSTASYAMNIINDNIELAKLKSQPLCQDTGTVIFFIYHPPGFHQTPFKELIKKAVVKATQKGYLRQNSVNSLTGENAGTNLGEAPSFNSLL